MSDAILWGLIQGLTEFLPVSSSGHLVLVPALLGRDGPDLAITAVLHLGTLIAVLAYFRRDIAAIARFDRSGRKLATLLVLGTIPAAILGLTVGDRIDDAFSNPARVGVALMITGIVLLASTLIRVGDGRVEDTEVSDAVSIGVVQAFALIPGVSRSGVTIVAGMQRRFTPQEAARFSFLLGIPAIAGAGLTSIIDVGLSDIPSSVWLGVVVAAVSGYAAIAILLRLLRTVGLLPFGIYCIVAGAIALFI